METFEIEAKELKGSPEHNERARPDLFCGYDDREWQKQTSAATMSCANGKFLESMDQHGVDCPENWDLRTYSSPGDCCSVDVSM